MDTGEDDDISRDTNPMSRPMHLWSPWRVTAEELAPDLVGWYVSDGDDVKVPTRSEEHAEMLCEVMLLVEYEVAVIPSVWWLAALRRLLLRMARRLNRADKRHWRG